MNNEYKEWIKVVNKCNKQEKDSTICPSCKKEVIQYRYIGNKETKRGYLLAWCNECRVGIHCSRVHIPENEEVIDFKDEEQISKIPSYTMIMPT